VLVTGAAVLVTVDATGAAALATVLVAVLVAVLVIWATPPPAPFWPVAGVLVLATGAAVWAACLTTGATVFVTGASGWFALAELPLPPPLLELEELDDEVLDFDDWLPDPEDWVPAAGWPVFELEPLRPAAADVTGLAAALTADPTGERAEDVVDPRGDRVSRVDACACLENSIMTKKIPAATIASCIARRAMRRAIGCGMSTPLAINREDVGTSAARFPRVYAACLGGFNPKVMTCCAATNVQRFRVVRQGVWT